MRLFLTQEAVFSNYLKLSQNYYHHLSRVLRIKRGDVLDIIVDQDYKLVIRFLLFKDTCLYYDIISKETIEVRYPQVTLFQSLPKQDKFMSIIDGVTQCGVTEIYPIITDRSLFKVKSKKLSEKVSRWQKQAEQSAMQSKQMMIPTVHSVVSFESFLKLDIFSSFDICIVAWEDEAVNTLKSVFSKQTIFKKIGVFIGPEGGLSSADIDCLKSKDFKIISIGSTILRVEIAAVVAVTQILFFYL